MAMKKDPIPIENTPYRSTEVPPERSQGEIRKMLAKYNVSDVQFTHEGLKGLKMVMAVSGDEGHMNVYKMEIPFLTKDEIGERQGWRMLYWWMKYKLEAETFTFTDFETEMLPYRLVQTERGPSTIAETVLPQLRAGGTNSDPFRPALPSGEH